MIVFRIIKRWIDRAMCKHSWEYVPLLTIQKEMIVIYRCGICGKHRIGATYNIEVKKGL